MTPTNTSPGLGVNLPVPSAPPRTIFQNSTAEDVKLWVYNFIRQNQPYLSSQDAWAIAREVKGSGGLVLQYTKDDWDKEVPNWGRLIFIQLHQTPKYVVSTNKMTLILGLTYLLQIDTIFEILLVCQTILLFVAGGSGVYSIVTKSDLSTTKTIGLVFFSYTFALRIAQAILSSPWVHQWPNYPDFLKLKQSTDSFWKDFAGIPK